MKIAILGTRGIPNKYGGFEQFAENLSVRLVCRGHRVIVYSPHFHEHSQSEFKGVEIIKIKSPEKTHRNAANFIYDNRCVDDVIQQNVDVALVCGYATAVFSSKKMSNCKKPVFVVNMDGLEWARSKWNFLVKKFIQWAEKRIATQNINLVSDHSLIKDYYNKTYNISSEYIPYGTDVPSEYNEAYLEKYDITAKNYMLVISRIEIDNNLDMIIQGFLSSETTDMLIIVGNCKTKFGKQLTEKYAANNSIKFVGSIYDKANLDSLRHYSNIYFHGHSVGGTNPSLIEAMATGAFIISHDNIYNREVLKENAMFFSSPQQISNIINDSETIEKQRVLFSKNNIDKIRNEFSWKKIVDEYENLFFRLSNIKKDI